MTTTTLLEAGPAPALGRGQGPGRPPATAATTPTPGAVFAPPEDPHDRIRMVRAHAAAAGTLCVRTHGERTWGFKGRTLSRRADDHHWLRVVSAPLDQEPGITWDGTACADALLPRSVLRPRVHDLLEWTDRTHRYRAELSEHVPRPTLQSGGPVLTRDLDLPDTCWADLRAALTVTATVPACSSLSPEGRSSPPAGETKTTMFSSLSLPFQAPRKLSKPRPRESGRWSSRCGAEQASTSASAGSAEAGGCPVLGGEMAEGAASGAATTARGPLRRVAG